MTGKPETDAEAALVALHCWADGPPEPDGVGTTCMRAAGHAGPHRWTRDDEIHLSFRPARDDRRERLEEERHRLMHEYGHGPVRDGAIRARIAEIDRMLADDR